MGQRVGLNSYNVAPSGLLGGWLVRSAQAGVRGTLKIIVSIAILIAVFWNTAHQFGAIIHYRGIAGSLATFWVWMHVALLVAGLVFGLGVLVNGLSMRRPGFWSGRR